MNDLITEEEHLELQPVYDRLTDLIANSRRKVESVINSELLLLYWNIGKTIKISILNNQRAEYGKQTIAVLSQHLSSEYGRGFSQRNLFNMINFYEIFPDESILQTLSAKLTWSHFLELIPITDPLKRNLDTGETEDIIGYECNKMKVIFNKDDNITRFVWQAPQLGNLGIKYEVMDRNEKYTQVVNDLDLSFIDSSAFKLPRNKADIMLF